MSLIAKMMVTSSNQEKLNWRDDVAVPIQVQKDHQYSCEHSQWHSNK